jgi:hypothetical protein
MGNEMERYFARERAKATENMQTQARREQLVNDFKLQARRNAAERARRGEHIDMSKVDMAKAGGYKEPHSMDDFQDDQVYAAKMEAHREALTQESEKATLKNTETTRTGRLQKRLEERKNATAQGIASGPLSRIQSACDLALAAVSDPDIPKSRSFQLVF